MLKPHSRFSFAKSVFAILGVAMLSGQIADSATFTVTTTADSGAGSLRQAILEANATVGVTDTIEFNIPTSDPGHVYYMEDLQSGLPGIVTQTTEADDANLNNPDLLYPRSWYRLSPSSPLPAVTDTVTIDGYTQGQGTGSSGDDATPNTGTVTQGLDTVLRIELHGAGAGFAASGIVLNAGSDGSLVRGLAIKDFSGNDAQPGHGILIFSNNNRIEGNFLGPGVDGISRSNNTHGIAIVGNNNAIGGTAATARNLISGNNRYGLIIGVGSGNVVQGNVIGLNRTCVAGQGNFRDGILITDAPDNTVGGSEPSSRNLVSGNGFGGISIINAPSVGNIIQGNYVGTDLTGTVDIGNTFHGILCFQASSNTIGGTDPGEGNVSSGNGQGGITFDQVSNSMIQGNILGTDPSGNFLLGNGFSGVLMINSSSNLVDSNVAAFNTRDGILMTDNSMGNRISQNSIYSNTNIGIDLSTVLGGNATGDGITANDPGDPDTGPNNHQNFPVISSADLSGTLDITYSVDSLNTNSAYPLTVEFFESDIDGLEGRTFLGSDMYADGAGSKAISINPMSPVSAGDRIVSTVTDANGNTSEFSASIILGGEATTNTFTVNSTGNSPDLNTADGFCNTGNLINGDPECTLCAAIEQANAVANANGTTPDEILFDIPSEDPNHLYYMDNGIPGSVTQTIGTTIAVDDGTISGIDPDWPHSWYSIVPVKALPELTDAVLIDGYSQSGSVMNSNSIGQGLNTILKIELNAALAGVNYEGAFNGTAGGCRIKGISINRVEGPCVRLGTLGGNRVEGCFLGPDISGLSSFPRPGGGAVITDRSGVFVATSDNVVGGATRAAKNLISGNVRLGGNGVRLGDFGVGTGTSRNLVQGNLIGTDRTGTRALENAGSGVRIDQSSGNTIGGASPEAGNVISGNGFLGVEISVFPNGVAADNLIENNTIGADVTGSLPVPNELSGIGIENVTGNIVSRNTIAFNGRAGVLIEEGFAQQTFGNLVTMNSIFSNFSIGIDLQGSAGKGIINDPAVINFPQDEGDADAGANNFQNFPVITDVSTNETISTISGTLNSSPNSNYRIELFVSEERDPLDFGEGETFVGAVDGTTDANGDATFSTDVPSLGNELRFVTATATDITDRGAGPANDTSEFSAAFPTGECNFVVTNVNDSGNGSLRETIFCANSQVGIDTISFDIPGVGPHIIQILSPLPQITEGVIIDGYTQGQGTPGDTSDDAVPNSNPVGQGLNMQLKIALDGEISRSTIDTNGFTLTPSAGGSVIRGLAIYNCDFGIVIEEAQANRIEGNIIGLDISGTVEQRNREDGIRLFNASDNTIGGLEPDKRNLVSENLNGVFITGASSTGNLVQGNLIGTDITGMLALGNGDDGVYIRDGPSGTVVGGTDPNSANLLSANGDDGLEVELAGENTAQGNFFGITVDGSQPLGHGEFEEDGDCIDVYEAWNNRIIGNVLVGGMNIFSDGVQILGASSTGNIIQANFIGTDEFGATHLGNMCEGIFIGEGASNNKVGGLAAGDGNTIAHNQTNAGVHVEDATSTGNAILGNSIFSNAGLGIDLGVGVTTNDVPPASDPPDQDDGPNNRQNFPMITSVSSMAKTTTIQGTLESIPNTDFRIEFFGSSMCDPAGYGEGQILLGSDVVTTDANGLANFESIVDGLVATGDRLTSTATRIEGQDTLSDTSEFSLCYEVTEGVDPTPTPTPGPGIECDHLDFDGNQVVDCRDLLQLLTAVDTGNLDFDLTDDGMVDESDVFRFSQCWYVLTGMR